MIFSVLVCASAVDTNGAAMAGANPAAPATTLVVLRKSRRDQLRLLPPDAIARPLFACRYVDAHSKTALDDRAGRAPPAGACGQSGRRCVSRPDRGRGHLFRYRIMNMR